MFPWALGLLLAVAAPPEVTLDLVQAIPSRLPYQVELRGEQPLWTSAPLRGGEFARELPADVGDWTVRLTGESAQPVETPLTIPSPGRWTLLVLQPLGEPRVALLPVAPPVLAGDQAALRVAHAAADLGPLSIRVKRPEGRQWVSLTMAESLSRGEVSDYLVTSPGVATLQVFEAGEQHALHEYEIRFVAGLAWTVVLAGLDSTESDDDLPLTLLTLLDGAP